MYLVYEITRIFKVIITRILKARIPRILLFVSKSKKRVKLINPGLLI